MNFCPNCGQQLAEDTRFCPKCGKTVQQEAPTEEPAATTPQPTPEQAPQDATAVPQGQFPQEVNTSSATPEQAPQRPSKKKKKVLFIIAGVFVFLFIVIIALASGGNKDKPSGPPDKVATMADGERVELWEDGISVSGLQYYKSKDGTLYYIHEERLYLASKNLLTVAKITEEQLAKFELSREAFNYTVAGRSYLGSEEAWFTTDTGGEFDSDALVLAVAKVQWMLNTDYWFEKGVSGKLSMHFAVRVVAW